MFYAWIFFENRFKDVYLPSTEKWSESIAIYQSESGWDRDYFITVRSLDGKCFVSPAEKFHWLESPGNNAELPVNNNAHYYMLNGRFKLGIAFADCKRSDTCFKKFTLPIGQQVLMGRGTTCDLRIAPEIGVVSKNQGTFLLQSDGSCIYSDSSRNGSYLNGLLLASNSVRLRFGDVLTLNAGIKFIYLGSYIAINRMSAFAQIGLPLTDPPAPVKREGNMRIPSVQIQHHRAPRFLQKPDTSDIKIEPPLDKQEQRNMPLWLTIGPSTTMVLPMLMGTMISSANGTFMGAGLAMVGTASVLAVFWGLLNSGYRKKQAKEIEDARVAKYALYIQQAEQYLQQVCAQEYRRLLESCPNVEECSTLPQDNAYRLWERTPKHADFMSVRLGLGDVSIPNKIIVDDVKLSAIDDPLRDEPSRLADTYHKIRSAPLTVNIRQETIIGILGTSVATSLAQSILLQLAALHSYHDVRIAVITDEGDHSRWSWARWLPHVFASEDRQLRMVVSEDNAIQEVLTHLDEILIMRNESVEESGGEHEASDIPLPHYVVFCTKPELLENKPLLRHMLSKSWGMTLILLAPSMEVLPKECRIVLDASNVNGAMYYADGDVQNVDFEYPNQALLESFSHMVAPLRVKDAVESAAIPTMVSFLDIYAVRRIEDLDIWRFWNENHVYEGIKSTIGLRSGSLPFVLDISDKSHGPHGLIAGTTGSGKSVMLQTYILSLAVNYHPDQVRFILIDYKGGGMADAFRDLPHVTGIIDNLQTGNTIVRALASIHGEIHRREQIFRKVGVSSIDDYIRFFYDDPAEERLPHLIIIVDEFAELKSDQPEFMQELISASRVGRSLGVHLILSTQKPSNSVSDEIWANSNFRICLRVQSRSDSMEMLRRPDAAYLKSKGRCYIQVGNDEIFEQAQTSYSGLVYNPDEPSETEMPHLLDNAGRLVAVKRPKAVASGIRELTQMDAVMDRIATVAREHGIADSANLWMEELPAVILMRKVPQSAEMERSIWSGPNTGMELRTVFAMGDDVLSQRQFPVWLDLMNNRNHMIIGMASTGKTTFMQTLIMSFAMRYSPAAVQMYILSLSSRTLGSVSELPHIGEIIYADETDELRRLLRLLDSEDQRRRQLFAQASTDSFIEYNHSCEMKKQPPVPAIIVFVDRFAQLAEGLQDDEEFTQGLYNLIREASARGIYFVVSAMQTNEIPYKIRDCFKGIGLQINDRADYTEIVGMRMPSDMPDIAPFAGRGLYPIEDRLYEIQIALAGSYSSDVERAQELQQICSALNTRWEGIRPRGIPRIPEHPSITDLISSEVYQKTLSDSLSFSFLYRVDSGLPEVMDLASSYSYLILGGRQSGKTNALQLVARLWKRKGANICIAADEAWDELCRSEELTRYDLKSPEWESYVAWLNEEIKTRAGKRKVAQAAGSAELDRMVRGLQPVVIIIDDLESFISKNPDVANRLFAEVAKKASKFAIYLFASVSHNAYAQIRMQEPLVSLARQQRGLALGGKLNECDPWNVQMPFSKKNVTFPRGEAYLIDNGESAHVVIPRAE